MFGPLSRAGRATSRNNNRRLTFAVVIVILLCLLVGEVIDMVVNDQSSVDTRTDATYFAAMVPIVRQSNDLLPLLNQIRNAPSDLTNKSQPRAVLAELLEELQSGADSVRTAYANIGLSAPSATSNGFISQAFSDRSQFASALGEGVRDATSGSTTTAEAQFRRSSALLSAGDHNYAAFLRSLPKIRHGIKLKTSKWNDPQKWTPASTSNWSRALTSSHVLVAKQGVKIVAVALDPAAVSISGLVSPTTTTTTTTTTSTTSTTTTTTTIVPNSSNGSTTTTFGLKATTTTTVPVTTTTNQIPPLSTTSNLPSTSTLDVTVVIASDGNVPLSDVVVTATATPTSSPPKKKPATTSSKQTTVASLAAAGARYIDLGKLHVVSGASYRLLVTAQPKLGTAAHDTIKLKIG